ncbi:MAG: helix-turn-helix transcriptional regulator, partial [Solirubrobacterales bacterium]|nr:helix-turn-helix transcriptional regulator [Solirubrobacterales bacterium]
GLREQGRLGVLTQALGLLCWSAFLLGDWPLAASAAAEEAALARETAQPMWEAAASMAVGGLAGVHGDEAEAARHLDEADAFLRPRRISALLCLVEMQRGLSLLTLGRPDEAYDRLRRIFDPADPAHHYREQFCAVGLFADAAALTGRQREARQVIRRLGEAAAVSRAPGLLMGLQYARPLLAGDGEDAGPLFASAIRGIGPRRRFDRARLHLAFGTWLRRRRRVVDSRAHLRLACDAFDELRVAPWADRARRELRAAGEASGNRRTTEWSDLSPPEQQIARMAAAGLSNPEIARRLYLSHRTVANHLYRTFPKLGITSRTQLHDVLPVADE